MGFISNPDEEKYLASEAGQTALAKTICDAFGPFYRRATGLKIDTVLRIDEEPVKPVQVTESKPVEKTEVKSVQPQEEKKVLYAVQIFALHEELPENDPRFGGLKGCKYIKSGDWYKYYYGATTSREEVTRLQHQLNLRFPGCFVIKL